MFVAETDEDITVEWFTTEEILSWGSYDQDWFGHDTLEETLDTKREDDWYEDVMDSLKSRGFWRPITARRSPSTGRMMLGDGHHRFAAALDLGMAYVPVQIHNTDDGSTSDIIAQDSGGWYAIDPIDSRFYI